MSADPTSSGSGPNEAGDDFDGGFRFHFQKAGELLQIDQLEEAEKQLEMALGLKPDNPNVLNLLGLVYFRQGHIQQSIVIYRDLIERYQDDATLRVNLAMVYLKNDQLDEAEAELQTAVELSPDHEKAHRSLAVVKMKKGEAGQAHQDRAPAGIDDVEPVAERTQGHRKNRGSEAAPPGEPGPEPKAIQGEATVEPTAPFSLDDQRLVADSPGRLFTRLPTLTWIQGDLKFTFVKKRFEGEATRYTFGSGKQAMVLVEGAGQLQFSVHENGYCIHSQGEEPGYFMEEYVFAFGDVAFFENGRLPSEEQNDPPIFHLRGPAQMVLTCPGELRTRRVTEDKLLLDLGKLVGWSGDLTPRVVKISRPLPTALWIELSGTGAVYYMG
jgi:hypothetical protein